MQSSFYYDGFDPAIACDSRPPETYLYRPPVVISKATYGRYKINRGEVRYPSALVCPNSGFYTISAEVPAYL